MRRDGAGSPPRVALVTGCSGAGLGHALALGLDSERTPRSGMAFRAFATGRCLADLGELHERCIEVAELDVTQRASVSLCVAHVLAKAGSLDVLVCNAGGSAFGPLVEQSMDELKEVLDTTVLGTTQLLQAAAPIMMMQRSGHIVVVGSADADVVTPWAAASSASQAALRALVQALRQEVAPFGVRVTWATVGPLQSQAGPEALQGPPLDKYAAEGCAFHEAVDGMERRAWPAASDDSLMTAEAAAAVIIEELQRRRPRRNILVGARAKQLHRLGLVQQWLWPSLVERRFASEFGVRDLARTCFAKYSSAPPLTNERLSAAAKPLLITAQPAA